jgi:hypothetical protein
MEGANLTAEEREIVRDFDAYAWGSLDVSLEQVLSQLQALTLFVESSRSLGTKSNNQATAKITHLGDAPSPGRGVG